MKLRIRYMTRKNKMLFELGIALVLIILFFGFLGSLTTISKTPIINNQILWDNNATIQLSYINSTSGASVTKSYNIRDIATLYNGSLYIQIPQVQGYDKFDAFAISLNNVTYRYVLDRGLNTIEYDLELIGDDNSSKVTRLELWPGAIYFNNVNFNGTQVHVTYTVDPGSLLLKATGHMDDTIIWKIQINPDRPVSNLNGIRLAFNAYSVSKRPVLSAITEPVYSVIATLYTGILAVYRRVKQYASTLFGGFMTHFSLTALIGDPVTALLLTVVFLTIVFAVMKKR